MSWKKSGSLRNSQSTATRPPLTDYMWIFTGGRNKHLVEATVTVGLGDLHLHLIPIHTRHLPHVVEFWMNDRRHMLRMWGHS